MQLRGRQTQFHIDVAYGVAFSLGFGYLLFYGMDARIAAFQGGLVLGYFLRVWEKMTVYEQVLEEEVAQAAEAQVSEEVEERVPDAAEAQVATEVAEQVPGEVAFEVEERVESEVPDEVEEQVQETIEREVTDEVIDAFTRRLDDDLAHELRAALDGADEAETG